MVNILAVVGSSQESRHFSDERFNGYILAGSQSGSPKDYAKSNSASYATLFEGINKFPNEISEYSSNVQEYNEELIVNFISEFLRIYIN